MKKKRSKDKKISFDAMFNMIKPGSRIFLSSGAAMPVKSVIEILKSDHQNLVDLEFIQLVTLGSFFSDNSSHIKYRLKTFNVGEGILKDIQEGKVDFVPSHISGLPYLFSSQAVGVDIAIIQTSPPDDRGYLNLGIATVVADIVIKKAPIVIAEINPNVPVTHGETSIHMDQIDYFIESNLPLIEQNVKPYDKLIDKIIDKIGWNIANLINDGSTVSLHYGLFFNAVAYYLKSKRGLRIYSHVVSDWIIDLIESGSISLNRGMNYQRPVTTSSCFGSKKLYNYVHKNPSFEFAPLLRSTYQSMIPRIHNLISIIDVKKIDVSGDLVLLYSGDQLLSGFDSKLNFAIAAAQSRGGKTIVALRSLDIDGKSNIVISHKDPSRIRSTLGTTHYVVTEYGVANILGKSIRERTLAMIDIADPNHRDNLLNEAKSAGYLYPDQIYVIEHAINYPFNLETIKTFKNSLEVKFRPIKTSDEDMMRRLFYQFSDETKYLRYFSLIRSMPHKKMQPYVNIDYNTTLSLVGIKVNLGGEQIIAETRYSYNDKDDTYEMAFVVDEKYQGYGIGTFMFNYLIDIAKERGIKQLSAHVLTENRKIIKLLMSSKIDPVIRQDDEEVYFIYNLIQ